MSLFWRILAIGGGLLLLLLIGVAIAIKTIDVNTFLGPIQNRVRDATGRDLAIKGGIEIKLSLEPKVVLQDVTLSNAPWATSPQMIAAKRVEVQMALLPLLHRDFQVRTLSLIEPVIALETDAKGTGNWQFGDAAAGAPAAVPVGAATTGGFFVGDVAIKNGTLTYRDGESGKLTTVAIEDFALTARDPQSPVSARFRGKVDDFVVALEGDLGPLTTLVQRRWPYPVSLKGQVNGQQTAIVTQVRVEEQTKTVTLDPLELGVGKNRVTGQVAISPTKPRPKFVAKLVAPTLSLADLPIAGKAAPAVAKAASKSIYIFSEEIIDLSALKTVDGSVDWTIDSLVLTDGRKLDHVRFQATVLNGVLDAPVVQAGIFGGAVSARLKIDASRDKDAVVNVHLDAKGLDLAALFAVARVKREVRGGKTSVNADLAMRGASQRQWASTASGNATMIVGPATLGHPSDNSDVAFNRLADAVNPFRKSDPSTEILCAVVRLPLASGIAKVDRSIAIETNKVGANASGTLDFRNETLDLSIKPQFRQGIKLDISQIASLVRFHGPFSAPVVGVDSVASAKAIATIGAAAATGGMSLLGQELLARARADPGAPCQIALGNVAKAQPETNAPASAPAQAIGDVGSALGKLFKR
ncbi:MAG: AsmA family protein [Casimicrobiaceae bacterium]